MLLQITDPTQGTVASDINAQQTISKSLAQQISDFEDRLAAVQQQLSDQYSKLNVLLQQYPMEMQQVSSQLGALNPQQQRLNSPMKIPNAASAYCEAAWLGASPLGLVVLLYDRLAQDLHHAAAAMKSGETEARAVYVNHALLILQQLQGGLDFAAGGVAARQLDTFYGVVRGKLLEAQIRQSPELLTAQAQAIAQVREGWAEVESSLSSTSTPIPQSAPDAADSETAALSLGA